MVDIERGKFIVLEGPDGSGKTTQSRLLIQWFESNGLPVVQVREPGGTEWGENIRSLLLERTPENKIHPLSELLAFYSARNELLETVIGKKLNSGVNVIADRFDVSSYAYQGVAWGLGGHAVQLLSELVVHKAGYTPDLCIMLDVSAQTGLLRKGLQPDGNKFYEKLEDKFQQKVREGYKQFISESQKGRIMLARRVVVIDASAQIDSVHQEIITCIEKLFVPTAKEGIC